MAQLQEGRPSYNEDGHTANHLFLPWWGHNAQVKGELNFPRGYHFEMGTGFKAPGSHYPEKLQGYATELKRRAKHDYGSHIGLSLRGEILPNQHCYMEIDDQIKVAVICDILIPRDGAIPSASEVDVPAVIDEWVSAPYPSNQSGRIEILSGLAWIDQESQRRFETGFVQAYAAQRLNIIDDIAYEEAQSNLRYIYIAKVFDGLRTLVTIAFFASPEGTRDLGYLGNTPIAGDYPSPTPQAMEHPDGILQELALSDYAYL